MGLWAVCMLSSVSVAHQEMGGRSLILKTNDSGDSFNAYLDA